MNIFEEYIKKITQLIEKNKNLLQLNEFVIVRAVIG